MDFNVSKLKKCIYDKNSLKIILFWLYDTIIYYLIINKLMSYKNLLTRVELLKIVYLIQAMPKIKSCVLSTCATDRYKCLSLQLIFVNFYFFYHTLFCFMQFIIFIIFVFRRPVNLVAAPRMQNRLHFQRN